MKKLIYVELYRNFTFLMFPLNTVCFVLFRFELIQFDSKNYVNQLKINHYRSQLFHCVFIKRKTKRSNVENS